MMGSISNRLRLLAVLPILALLAACHSGESTGHGAGGKSGAPANGRLDIRPEEVLRFTGTEPFWGGSVTDGELIYTTPENPAGQTITVQRFNGRNGLGFSGTLGTNSFDMAITRSSCSDGMSDRTYPFTTTLRLGGELRMGCAWTDREPFKGAAKP